MVNKIPTPPTTENLREIRKDLILERLEAANDLIFQSQSRLTPILDNPATSDEIKSNISSLNSTYESLRVQLTALIADYKKQQ